MGSESRVALKRARCRRFLWYLLLVKVWACGLVWDWFSFALGVGYLVNMGIDWNLDWIPIEIDLFLHRASEAPHIHQRDYDHLPVRLD